MQLINARCGSTLGILAYTSIFLTLSCCKVKAQETPESQPAVLAQLHIPSLDDFDHNAVNLARHLGYQLPSPLILLSTSTGVKGGIDTTGAASIYLIAIAEDLVNTPVLCVSLSVSDYARFVDSLGGTSSDGSSDVTIAGQPMSVARAGNSAILVDRNHGKLLGNLSAALAESKAQNTAALGKGYSVSLAIEPAGLQLLMSLSEQATEEVDEDNFEDDLFGIPVDESDEHNAADGVWGHENVLWSNLLSELSRFLQERRASELLHHAKRASIGLSPDERGNLALDCAVTWAETDDQEALRQHSKELPHQRFGGSDFITFGGGSLPKIAHQLFLVEADAQIDKLMLGTPVALYTEEKRQFLAILEEVLDDVRAVGMLHRQAELKAGCYSNSYLVLECENASRLTAKVVEAFKSWNWLMDNAEGDLTLQFNSEPTSILGRKGIEYSADMIAALGFDPLPEIRKGMEELFGPGGLYRFQVVTLDDRRVLFANASKTQTEDFLVEFKTKKAPLIESVAARPALELMPENSNFTGVFNPRAYTLWLERSGTAGTQQIIGGPIVQPFPESQPVGLSGHFAERKTELRFVAPVDTIRALGTYLRETN